MCAYIRIICDGFLFYRGSVLIQRNEFKRHFQPLLGKALRFMDFGIFLFVFFLCCLGQLGLELRDLLASASQVLGIKQGVSLNQRLLSVKNCLISVTRYPRT